jgi:hypothetical protein
MDVLDSLLILILLVFFLIFKILKGSGNDCTDKSFGQNSFAVYLDGTPVPRGPFGSTSYLNLIGNNPSTSRMNHSSGLSFTFILYLYILICLF